jgi:hypothetical protein
MDVSGRGSKPMKFRPELSVIPLPNSIQRSRPQVQFHFVRPPFQRGMVAARFAWGLIKIGEGNALLQPQLQLICDSREFAFRLNSAKKASAEFVD